MSEPAEMIACEYIAEEQDMIHTISTVLRMYLDPAERHFQATRRDHT